MVTTFIRQTDLEDTYKILTGGHYFDRDTKRSFSHRHIESVGIMSRDRYLVLCSHKHEQSARQYDVLIFDATGLWHIKRDSLKEARKLYEHLRSIAVDLPPAIVGEIVEHAIAYGTDIPRMRSILSSFKKATIDLVYDRKSKAYNVVASVFYARNRWSEPSLVSWSKPLSFIKDLL